MPTKSWPNPDSYPLVLVDLPIHAEALPAGDKDISQPLFQIAFNWEIQVFQVEILSHEGAYVEDTHISEGGVHPLKSGYTIKIEEVLIRFLLSDVPITSTGAEAISPTNLPAKVSINTGEIQTETGDRVLPRNTHVAADVRAGKSVVRQKKASILSSRHWPRGTQSIKTQKNSDRHTKFG